MKTSFFQYFKYLNLLVHYQRAYLSTVTAPVPGGRISVDISCRWYVSADGSIAVPASKETGYKALNTQVEKRILNADITIHSLYIGLTETTYD